MSPRDRIRRRWTHRRLGLGAAGQAGCHDELARTDAMLTTVGARRPPNTGSAFEAALFDFVCDLDLAAGVPDIDRTPIPIAALRAKAAAPRRRRFGWRVLLPTASAGLAALAIAATMVFAAGSSPSNPTALTATAESKQLLTHADMLLTSAEAATATERADLVTEAKADLSHVSRLLPLAPPQSQPEIRQRLQLLDRRVQPLTSRHRKSPRSGAINPGTGGGSGGTPSSNTAGAASGSDPGADGTAETQHRNPSLRRPPATDENGGRRTGPGGPPRSGTNSGAPSGPTYQAPPRGAAPPPPANLHSSTVRTPFRR